MPVYRITFGFAGANLGWTETHALLASSSKPSDVLLGTGAVANNRAQMLGFPFVLTGTRISIYSDNGVPPNRLPRSVFLDKTQYTYIGGGLGVNDSEPYPVQYQASGFAALTAPAAYQGNENTTYLGGPLDICVDNAGQVHPEKGGLFGAFNAWKAAMIGNGFGWLAATKVGKPMPITTFANLPTGQVELTVTDPNAPALVSGVYNIRVSGVNLGRSPLNGGFVATYNATTKVWVTNELVAFIVAQTGGQVVPYSRVLTFVPYGNIILQKQTIKHKRGKPFLSPLGRARKRIRA